MIIYLLFGINLIINVVVGLVYLIKYWICIRNVNEINLVIITQDLYCYM
jgi:hypothetical protein